MFDSKNMLKMLLDEKLFLIPNDFPQITNVDLNIFKIMKSKKNYFIKSDVNEKVFQSFLEHWIYHKIPNILIKNLLQYDQLSQEFDRMKDLIHLYKKFTSNKAIFNLMIRNQELKNAINHKKEELKTKDTKYHQEIHNFFQNNKFFSHENFLINKQEIGENGFIDLITQNSVIHDGMIFILNEEEKTAGVFHYYQAKGDVIIPKSVNYKLSEYLVTSICDSAFVNSKQIKSIQFPDDSKLRKIGKYAFACSFIQKVQIPSSVRKIGESAFCDCSLLETVEFSDKSELKSIKDQTFSYSKISSLTIPSSVEVLERNWCSGIFHLNTITVSSKNKMFANYDKFVIGKSDKEEKDFNILYFAQRDIVEAKIPSFIEQIASCAFNQCKKLQIVDFEKDSKLKSIGNSSFNESSLTAISIPSHVVKIKSFAFANCPNLERIEFACDSELRSIGEFAFCESSLKNISFPDHLTFIGECAFSSCQQLQSAEFSDKSECKSIGKSLFSKSSLKSIALPSSIDEFDDDWCREVSDLTNIKIYETNANNICYYDNSYVLGKSDSKSLNFDVLLFARRDIQKVIIPSFIKMISNHAFSDTLKLESIEFSEGSELNEIGFDAFAYSKLKKIVIPPNVSRIEKNTFYGSSLESIEFSSDSKLNFIGEYAFGYCPLQSLTIPSSFGEFENNWCFGVSKLNDIEISQNEVKNIMYYDQKFVLGKSDKKSNVFDVLLFSRQNIKCITIPSFITRIAPLAFAFCNKIEKVEFQCNSKLKTIDESAFSFSSLNEIKIPRTVTHIMKSAFFNCKSLQIVDFEKDSELKFIGTSAFTFSSLNSICIPKSVIHIGNAALSSCKKIQIIEFSDGSEMNKIVKNIFQFSSSTLISVPLYLKDCIV